MAALIPLSDILRRPEAYEPDDVVYVPANASDVGLDTEVRVELHGSVAPEDLAGYRYLLEAGVIREVVDGLASALGRAPTEAQSLRAVLYYAENDAFPDMQIVFGPD